MRPLTAPLCLLGWALVGCRVASPAPAAPAAALEALVDAAVAGDRPDPHGWVDPADPVRSAAFLHVERWVNVNAESVTDVHAAGLPAEAAHRFARSADGRYVYAFAEGWPGRQFRTKAVQPPPGAKVRLLGWPEDLRWTQLGAVCVVETPRELADDENHPCEQVFVFRFQVGR
jgi:hypothetical protein